MKIGFGAPVSGVWATPENLASFAASAEAAGYASLWTFQRLMVPEGSAMDPVYHSVLDPMVSLGYLAAVTQRIRLGVAVVNMPYLAPGYLAKMAATADVLSGGRLDLGLGIGWMPEEFTVAGGTMARRGARTGEYIEVMRRIWAEGPAEFHGRDYELPAGWFAPRPVQRPGPPILIGGSAPAALQRAGRLADGWVTSSRTDLSRISEGISVVRSAAEDAGRDPDSIRIVCRGVVHPGEPLTVPEGGGRVTYTYYEQLNGYKDLKSLGIGYHFYRGRYVDAINEILNPDLKTIIHIPRPNAAESTTDKYAEVDHILDHIGVVLGKDTITGFYLVKRPTGKVLKVADLVDEGPVREQVMHTLRDIKGRDDIDIIIALGMAKEGFDWIWCEHALTVGYRGSLTEVIQIIGRATRDAPGKEHAQFTNLIAEPDASEERVADAVNNMLKAIAVSLLMEQVLAPNFKFKTKKDADELDGSRKESDIVYTGADSTIAIKGFKEPSTPRTKQIIESDLNDLSAAIFQDESVLRAAMNPEEYAPEVVNQVFIPKVIATAYPDLTQEEVEEVRQAVVANAVFKSPSVEFDPNQQGDNKFIKMAEKLVNVAELNIDLIDSINPFQRAYEILSKSVTADILKSIHGAITSIKVPMSKEEAETLWPRIKAFKQERGVEPNLGSPNPLERRMAEALEWLRAAKLRKMSEQAN